MRRLLLLALLLTCAAPVSAGWFHDKTEESWLVGSIAPSGSDGIPLTIHVRFSTVDDVSRSMATVTDADGSFLDRNSLFMFNAASGQTTLAASRSVASGATSAASTTQYAQDGTWQTSTAIFAAADDRTVFLNGAGKGTDSTTITAPATMDAIVVSGNGPTNGSLGSGASTGLVAVYDTALTDGQALSLEAGAWPPFVASASLAVLLECFGQGTTEPDVVSGTVFDSVDRDAVGGDDFPVRVGHKNLCPRPGMQ